MNAGQAIIDAVIRAAAVESAVQPTKDSTIFVWSANAAEQIEAALAEAGYKLEETAPQSVTELASKHPALLEYIKGMEDQILELSYCYRVMRKKIVEDDAHTLYGGRQAAANYTPMEDCLTETSRRLKLPCLACGTTGTVPCDDSQGERHEEQCCECNAEGWIPIPELP